jgi:hypothetical protein
MSSHRRRGASTLGRLGLFVEGANFEDMRGRDALTRLWCTLCERCGARAPAVVVGFSKRQLVAMSYGDEMLRSSAGLQPLHLLIAQHCDRSDLDRVIVAFDALPANLRRTPLGDAASQRGVPISASPNIECMREEVDFVLHHFGRCDQLPESIRAAARRLYAHYSDRTAARRARSYGPLEVIHMSPNFEAVLVCDEGTVKRALLGRDARSPKEWPSFARSTRNPEQHILPAAVECASPELRRRVRDKFENNKHAWAEVIVTHASKGSRMLKHPTVAPLAALASRTAS